MGKHENSLDDYFIIRAFDDAISKYKIMHGQTFNNTSAKEGEVYSGSEENLSHILDKNHERMRGEDDKINIVSNNVMGEVGDSIDMSTIKEIAGNEPCVHTSEDPSNALFVEEMQKESVNASNLDLKGAAEYNQLLNQYYELEEKRQKILEQLYQYGGWNYQDVGDGSGNGIEQGVSSTYQEHPVSASHHEHVLTSCCPSGHPISAGLENSSLADSDIIKTAMDAAERAISSMKIKIPGDYVVNEAKERKRSDREMAQSASSDTDLAVVLNAWFSAGFHTGKYLMEQSYGKK